jgi:hypothetical protein
MYSDIKNVIDTFADDVQFKQIIRKCRLNNQIRGLSDVLQAMAFRKICYPEIGYFPNQVLMDVIWKGGIDMARTAEEHNLQASFTPTQEQISKFPSL